MEHLRRSLRFGHARLNASLAILPVRKTGGRGLGTIGVAENCVAVPFPAVRHVTYWLDRPQPAPAGAASLSAGDHLVERRGLRLSASLKERKAGKNPDRYGRELAGLGKRSSVVGSRRRRLLFGSRRTLN